MNARRGRGVGVFHRVESPASVTVPVAHGEPDTAESPFTVDVMPHTLSVSIPQDRRRALVLGAALPDRASGAALFADISGFTPLAARLVTALGPRLGTEYLSTQINTVYDALIAPVDAAHGSVISFAGDAITCWFDDADGASVLRAAACALAMQSAMGCLQAPLLPDGGRAILALKVAVAAGPARRFVVGDPAIQILDTLAGATLARVAAGEHLSRPGEVLLDAAAVAALGAVATLGAARTDPTSGVHFHELVALAAAPVLTPWPPVDLPDAVARPWILPIVADRCAAGLDAFLSELRPAVVLFLRFGGIEYDADDHAGLRLDTLIQRVQQLIAARVGTLLQLTIGDKGAYLYAAFGALVAHEDDARRAAQTALAIHAAVVALGFPPVQIGLSQGVLRVGAYGGRTRHTYGALGDEVNLAARLMTAAAPGETLLSGYLQKALGPTFVYEPRPPLALKGKVEPLPVFALTGPARRRAVRLQEPTYTLPMIGRASELAQVEAVLARASQGEGQVLGLIGEAGIGKSRLVAEAVRLAHRRGFSGYGGAAESTGTTTPYLAWKPVVQALLDLDPDAPLRRQVRQIQGELEDRVPERANALPLLGSLLDLPLEENDFTRTLAPVERKGTLEMLLFDLLTQTAREARGGLLLVLEDLHWGDPLTLELLAALAAMAAELPLFILLAYRPWPQAPAPFLRVEALPHFTRLPLASLDREAITDLVRAKLAQLIPARAGALPEGLVPRLFAQTQGNPFYTEELVSYLHDRGINPYDPAALPALELPDSLHRLVLARIDQLTERERATLRVASVIGRIFPATWLPGMVPDLGSQARINTDLDQLTQLDLTALDAQEPELVYLFKHIVTQEVAYASLPHTTQEALHEQLARWLEGQGREPPPLDLLAYHYNHSANQAKRREYLRRAGEAHLAQGNCAAAVASLTALLALLTPDDEEYATTARMVGETYMGLTNYPAAAQALQASADAARNDTDRALSYAAQAQLCGFQGDYAGAGPLLERALRLAQACGDAAIRVRVLFAHAELAWHHEQVAVMEERFQACRGEAHRAGDRYHELAALNGLGLAALAHTHYDEAEQCFQAVYQGARAIGNRKLRGWARGNLGCVAYERGDLVAARDGCLQARTLAQEVGNQESRIVQDLNLVEIDINMGHRESARQELRSALARAQRLGVVPMVLAAVAFFAMLAYAAGDLSRALSLYGVVIHHEATSSELRRDLERARARWGIDEATFAAGVSRGAALDFDTVVRELLYDGGTV